MYTLAPMNASSDEYRFLLKCFKNNTVEDFDPVNKLKNVSLYKVKEKSIAEVEEEVEFDGEVDDDEAEDQKYNFMLLHGTSLESIKGILSRGFKNSTAEDGDFGPGVYMGISPYMTDCVDTAIRYSEGWHLEKPKICLNNISCIFVNEVLNSRQLQTQCFDEWNPDDPSECKFVKYYHRKSPRPTKNDYKRDMKRRLYSQ